MRLAIPSSFQIANRSYTVRYASATELKTKGWKGSDGVHSGERAEIILRPGLHKEYEWHTFLHELVHAMLEALGRDDLSKDEMFVDILGGAIHQFLKTRKGKLASHV
jgi:hypothetical protein